MKGPLGPLGSDGIDNLTVRGNLKVKGNLEVNGININERLKIFNSIQFKSKLEDLKIKLSLPNKILFTIGRGENIEQWVLLDCQQEEVKNLAISDDIQVCLEYLYLLLKYSVNKVSDNDELKLSLLIQPSLDSVAFPIYEFERKELDEKDFIGRPLLFIKDVYFN